MTTHTPTLALATPRYVDASRWITPVDADFDTELGDTGHERPRLVGDGADALVALAARNARTLPVELDDALAEFADRPPRSGALLITGVRTGELPPTPPSPGAPTTKNLASELTLLTVARHLGQPVGYAPEHGGCVSWVDLPGSIGPPGERVPALSDDAFADSAAAVETALTAAGVIR